MEVDGSKTLLALKLLGFKYEKCRWHMLTSDLGWIITAPVILFGMASGDIWQDISANDGSGDDVTIYL